MLWCQIHAAVLTGDKDRSSMWVTNGVHFPADYERRSNVFFPFLAVGGRWKNGKKEGGGKVEHRKKLGWKDQLPEIKH